MKVLALALIAALVAGSKVFLERPDDQPKHKWDVIGKTNGYKEITVLLAVKQQNVDKLIKKLFAVSDPKSDEYGNFMTTNEVQALLQPTRDSILMIESWLKEEINIKELKFEKNNGDMVTFKTTINNLEKLLNTQYYDYKNVDNGDIVSRIKFDSDYYVPHFIKNHIDFISPTHRFPVYSTLKKSDGAGQVDPTFLRKLYNTGDTMGAASNNSVAVSSFRDQYYSKDDLETMWKDYDTTPTVVTNVPTSQPTNGHHLECELDTQYMSSMGQKVPMTAWYTGGINFPDALMEWGKNVLNSDNPPLLFSVSYGTTESYYGASFISRFNTELASMGTAGISVFFASGDSGAGGGCTTPPFEPDYPASSPYVTAVGGITGGAAGKQPTGETVWADGGGGFSNYAGTQDYQKDAVAAYLKNCASDLPAAKDFNSSGRAYPDISAQSVDFAIIVNGKKEAVSGTSCASPTAGGVFGLINDLRLQNGMKQLGFANPFIYQTAANNTNAFNDVTQGYNKGCGLSKGFIACQGFDAASGFGSPDYTEIVKVALKVGEKTKKFVK